MPSFMHIVRLSEDYVADSSASPPVTFYKQNLLLQISAKKDWVLVRVLFEASSTPIWIPKRLVTKAKPGFYRMTEDYTWASGASKKKGDVIRVRLARVEPIPLPLFDGYLLGPWIIDLIDGSHGTETLHPSYLEPVDVPTDPPATSSSGTAEDSEKPGLLKSLVGTITGKRRHTVGASDDGLPPYPHSDNGYPEEK